MHQSYLALLTFTQMSGTFQKILDSSLLALTIYFSLVILSIWTWAIIIKKILDFRVEKKRSAEFRQLFVELEGDIVALSQEGIVPSSTTARLFVAAYEELRHWATLDRSKNVIVAHRPVVPALERALDRAIEIEKERWEHGTTLLATISSISPLLGLLGTVWGIYFSFQEMGMADNASLRTVAPGISEALLTTVAGLLVAIPSLFAYNAIVRAVRKIEIHLESFAMDIINRFDRQIVVNAEQTPPAVLKAPAARRKTSAAT